MAWKYKDGKCKMCGQMKEIHSNTGVLAGKCQTCVKQEASEKKAAKDQANGFGWGIRLSSEHYTQAQLRQVLEAGRSKANYEG